MNCKSEFDKEGWMMPCLIAEGHPGLHIFQDSQALEEATENHAVKKVNFTVTWSDPVCSLCNGLEEIVSPAYQSGGEIVDEVSRPCICQTKAQDDER